jgi:hypothetical protein
MIDAAAHAQWSFAPRILAPRLFERPAKIPANPDEILVKLQ